MKTIKRYWLALIPFVLAGLFTAITVFCQPAGASTYIMPTGNDEPYTAWEGTTLTANPPLKPEIEVYPVIYTRRWESAEQFKDWYDSQNFTLLTPDRDCDDYAQWVQDEATKEGYAVSEAITWNGYYSGIWVTDFPYRHDGCLIEAAGWYYWIEPQANIFKIIKLFTKD